MVIEYEPLLTPGEVAGLFRVQVKTVSRWARSGLLPSIRTLGGHRRFRESDVKTLRGRAGDPGPRRDAKLEEADRCS